MWKNIKTHFRRGLMTLLPIVAPILLLMWLLAKAESIFDGPIKWIMDLFVKGGSGFYQWWFGLILAFVFIFGMAVFVGWALRIWAVKKTFSLINYIVGRVPVTKYFYKTIKNFADCFDPNSEKQLGKPVTINLDPEGKIRLGGFVTMENCDGLPDGLNLRNSSIVYASMAGNMGGYGLFVDKKKLNNVDMSPIDAFTLFFTAGMAATKTDGSNEES